MISPNTSAQTRLDGLKLSAEAFGRQGQYGAVVDLAERYGVSRPTVYARGRAAKAVLVEALVPRGGEARPLVTVAVDKARLRRAVIAARVEAPASVRDIQALVKGFYGLHVGYGTIHAILAEAEGRAAAFNRSVDLSGVEAVALDELFSQGDPVLAGIDLDTDYVFLLEHRKSRSGTDWAEALNAGKAQGLDIQTVVKDAGTGLAAGVTQAFPAAEQRDDAFHALQAMSKARRRLEQRGWATMEQLLEAEREHRRCQREGEWTASASQRLRHAREHFEDAAGRHDRFEALMQEAKEAMEFIGLDSPAWRDGDEQAARIRDIADGMASLGGKKVRGVARYLSNRAPGLARYMRELGDRLSTLAETYGAEVVGRSCQLWRLAKDVRRAPRRDRPKLQAAARPIIERIIRLASDRASEATHAVLAIVAKRHRASSAVEGFNALLRPYLHVHKRVSQGFLELYAAWRNLRTRPMGKHRGTSAYELLTGDKVDDWLGRLGYPAAA
jgi:hypothetical protein